MARFKKKFFSLAGQKERFLRAGQTIKAAVTGKGVTANVRSPVLKTVLEKAASNPFITAGVVAGAATPAVRAAAVPVVKAAATGASKFFLGTPLRAAATVTGIGVLQSSRRTREFAAKRVADPTGLGKKIGETIEKAIDVVEEHPVATALTAGGVLAAAGTTAAIIASKQREKDLGLPPIPMATGFVGGTQMPLAPALQTDAAAPFQTVPTTEKRKTISRRRTCKKVQTANQIRIRNQPQIAVQVN